VNTAQLVCLSLGSNLGDRAAALQAAVDALAQVIRIEAISPVYETDPVGLLEQPPFLNCALAGRSDLEPRPLLRALKAIERAQGRLPLGRRYGPRPIDIDLLFHGQQVLDASDERPALILPHAEAHLRAFVLVPLADIAPDLRHPRLGVSVAALRDAIGQEGVRPSGVELRMPARAALDGTSADVPGGRNSAAPG
jgi:2-amino-4-hydroxy-6-hydroxymethyldihydropteridine diphosphokinase